MDLRLFREGACFTLYSIEVGYTLAEYLENLELSNLSEHDRIVARLGQLADRGASRKKDEFNDLGDDLYEAKTRNGARVFFFYQKNQIVICTQGFSKQSQKTPKREIATALSKKRMYEQAKISGEKIRVIISDNQEKPRRLP